jgi:hypothetical protein
MSLAGRFLLYHKQATSARTLFLRFAAGHLLGPEPLPFLTAADATATFQGAAHPASLGLVLSRELGWPDGALEIDPDFVAAVETPTGVLPIHLARFTTIDPPRDWVEAGIGRFCAITELRGSHPAEMALLRQAYEHVLGG